MTTQHVIATYAIETSFPLAQAAEVLAGEQSTGTFVRVERESDDLRARFAAQVESIQEVPLTGSSALPGFIGDPSARRRGILRLRFPLDNFGPSMPNLLAAVAGNLFELKELSAIKLLDLELPSAFADRYAGPGFGVEGTRRLVGRPDGAMIGTIIKPSIGLAPSELAEVVGELAEAGVDFIKDDELQGNGPSAPLAERVRAVMPVLHRYADRTGRMPMYAFNITDDIGMLEANHDLVVSAGGTCVMACINLVGLSGLEFLRRHAEVPIHGHRAMLGAVNRSDQVGIGFGACRSSRAWPAPITCTRTASATSSTRRMRKCSPPSPRCARRCSDSRPRCRCCPPASGAGSRTRPTARSAAPTSWCWPAAASTVIRTARPPAWRACATPGARPRPASPSTTPSTAPKPSAGPGSCSGRCVSDLRVAFYGDDFTGSVDVLLQFARRGWTGRLFTALPDAATLARAAAEADVVGVAGIARSLPPAEMEAELRPALTALAGLHPHIVQYKACSTADSSPVVGSLGRVLEIGREVLGPRAVPMLFAQPDFGRFTVFGQHFAAEGGVVHRLDRQPTMSTHPSTPMTESDLAVHLSRQTVLPLASVPLPALAGLADRLGDAPEAGLVLDALTDDDLATVGWALLAQPAPVFAIGSGGLSHGIAAAEPGDAAAPPRATTPVARCWSCPAAGRPRPGDRRMPRPPQAGSCGRSPSTTPEPPSPRSWRRCGPGGASCSPRTTPTSARPGTGRCCPRSRRPPDPSSPPPSVPGRPDA